jgi:hypothetical protein
MWVSSRARTSNRRADAGLRVASRLDGLVGRYRVAHMTKYCLEGVASQHVLLSSRARTGRVVGSLRTCTECMDGRRGGLAVAAALTLCSRYSVAMHTGQGQGRDQ